MAKNVRIKWNRDGFRQLRIEPGVLQDMQDRAERIANVCGDGYVVDSQITGGRGRARASVRTDTPEAIIDNARNETLLRGLDAGR